MMRRMNDAELGARLEAVVARRIGGPGALQGLEPLTGGANRSTLSFDADIEGERIPLIVQLGVERPDPVAGITPELRPSDQAHLMIAAVSSPICH